MPGARGTRLLRLERGSGVEPESVHMHNAQYIITYMRGISALQLAKYLHFTSPSRSLHETFLGSRCGATTRISKKSKITAEGRKVERWTDIGNLYCMSPNSIRFAFNFTAHSFNESKINIPAASCFNANPTPPHRAITRHRQENHAPTPRRHRPNRKSRPSLGIVARDIDMTSAGSL
jgi:hypothetical protein